MIVSSLRMFSIAKNGDLHEFAKFSNSHRGWRLIWSWMEHEYFPIPDGKYSILLEEDKEAMKKFWHLAYDPTVGANRRIVMRCTYDGAMVKKEHFGIVAAAMRDVGNEMKRPYYIKTLLETYTMDSPGHLPDIADKLDEAAKLDDVIGVCWQGTTVDADAWGSEGVVYDHENDEKSRPFNIFKDKNWEHAQYWINPSNPITDDGDVTE